MNSEFLSRLMRCVLMLMVQVAIVNNIHLWGYATALVVGYVVVRFRSGASRISMLLWGFFAGLMFDMFSDTMGMCMISMTLLAMLQPALLYLFKPRDASGDFIPTIRTMGLWLYVPYVAFSMLALHSSFYLLEAFSFSNWQLTLAAICGGTLMSVFVIVFIEVMLGSTRRN
jgi:rod shape-determining protein MreD